MHINISASRAHRHIFAAPFLLLLVALSLSGSLSGSAQETDSDSVLFPFAGMMGEAEEGSLIQKAGDALVLEEGSVLLFGKGQVALSFGEIGTLLGITGGFHATKHGDSVTVAAITTPVLLTAPNGQVLVPTGMQWRGTRADLAPLSEGFSSRSAARSLTEIPSNFFAEQLKKLREPEDAEVDVLPPVTDVLPLQPETEDLLRFSAARERAVAEWQDATIGYLRGLLERGAFAEAEQYLSRAEAKELFADARMRSFIPALLGSARSVSSLPLSLFTHLASEEALLTVASIHPRYHAYVWTGGDTFSSSREAVLLRLLQLPASDRWSDAVPAFVVNTWQDAAKTFFSAEEDQKSALLFFTESVLSVITAAEDRGQPERALRYEEALRSILSSFESEASSAALALIEDHDTGEVTAIVPSPEAAVAIPKESIPAEIPWELSPEQTIAEAKALLLKAGALMSIRTTITDAGLPLLNVQNIIFPMKQGDVPFSFDLDMGKQEIKNIVSGDSSFPFALSVENFAVWVREQ